MKRSRSEIIQHALIFIFLLVGFLATCIVGYFGYSTLNEFTIGDWLINYRGGFVRRGLLGECALYMSVALGCSPALIVYWVQLFFYLLFFFFTYLCLLRHKNLKQYWLLIFSPFVFYFQVLAGEGGFRKEIIYLALLACLVWVSGSVKKQWGEKVFIASLVLYPFIILTHEALAVFLPYLLILYCYQFPLTKRRAAWLSPLLLASVAAFGASCIYHGDSAVVNAIFKSLEPLGNWSKEGSIDYLAYDMKTALGFWQNIITQDEYYKTYSVVAVLSVLPYAPIFHKLKKILGKRVNLSLIIVSVLGTIVLMRVTIDWGRFIYIHLTSLFLLSLIVAEEDPPEGLCSNWMIIFVLSVVYFSFWQIPHFGGGHSVIKDLRSTNVERLVMIFRAAPILFGKIPNP